jgi:hypothetical protein
MAEEREAPEITELVNALERKNPKPWHSPPGKPNGVKAPGRPKVHPRHPRTPPLP